MTFHGKPDGETTSPGSFAEGVLVGLLIGEGHFGGDGRQAQVTLRMHTRREQLFTWLTITFPGGKLYGPYRHGGRPCSRGGARGGSRRERLSPLRATHPPAELDPEAHARFRAMRERYGV